MKLHPCYKEYLWGGTRLRSDFGKSDGPAIIAESWELACHPDGNSVIASGQYAGRTLQEVIEADPTGMLGSACDAKWFPILVKLIDAKKDLSIQVHPSDQTALQSHGEYGKAEMWYVVESEPQACLYLGFTKKISKEEFRQRAEDGSICEVLNRVPVSRGDVFFILPGTIHAIGAGIVIAEIQQNSNTTFRVYDFKRLGSDGAPRPLHLDRASDVLEYDPVLPSECRANSSVFFPEFSMSEMFSCKYFKAYCLNVHSRAKLCCDEQSFQHVLCVEGNGEIQTKEGRLSFKKGESLFLPAAMGEYEISGECRMLLSRV